MITALIIGDTHFKVSNVRETDPMVEEIVKLASDIKPDIIVLLGDILDRHETIHVSPLTRAIKFMSRLVEIADTYVLIGNHDLKNNRQFLSDEHPFVSVKYWNHIHHNIKIIDTTTTVKIKNHIFVFVPYVPPGSFREALEYSNEWKYATCIFAHQEFKGCKMGAITSIEGDEWSLSHPFVVSGHIHDYQEPQVNILYTGTPIQHAYGDHHDKTVSLIQFESPHIRNHKRIDLHLPKKHIIRINSSDVSTYKPSPNSHLKIIISGTSGEIKAIMKHPNIDIWKSLGHRIVYKDIPIDKSYKLIGDHVDRISSTQLRFSTQLYYSVMNNPRLGHLYTDIFGAVKVSP